MPHHKEMLQSRIITFLDTIPEFKTVSTIAIAVSGGADSTALVLLMAEIAKEHRKNIIALTVDHGLRPAAKEEALHVSKQMAQHHIPHHILTFDGTKPQSNIQAHARNIRYDLLTAYCREHAIKYLCVAHHMEDQAETVLLRLMRGSGADGLSGMMPISTKQGITILRPLLTLSKTQLITYLQEHNISWIEDPSNNDPYYARTHVRRFISSMEDSAQITQHIHHSATQLQRTRQYLDCMMRQHLETTTLLHETGYITIKRDAFLLLHEEMQLRILSFLLHYMSGDPYKPRFDSLILLHQNMQTKDFHGATLAKCRIIPNKNVWHLVREVSAIDDTAILSTTPTLWDQRFYIHSSKAFSITHEIRKLEKKGFDSIRPLLDPQYLHTLPLTVIYSLPAIWHLENIIALPHISYYSDAALTQHITLHLKPF